MQFTVIVMGLVAGIELVIYLPFVWRFRRIAASIEMAVLVVASVLLLVRRLEPSTFALVFISLYRLVNMLRAAKGRIQADYLYNTCLRASIYLISAQFVVLGASALASRRHVRLISWMYLWGITQLIVIGLLLITTLRHLKTTRPRPLGELTADRQLPTLTVAIPARNETQELEDCLRSLVASDYPKLEILVLDDCSQNRRTPEIIRSFAQSGVIFIAGQAPPEHWLPKNYAYKQLAEEANGELLLFCGVDVRFDRDSLTNLVQTLLARRKSMLCLLPRNIRPLKGGLAALLEQPRRYAWELVLPRRWLERPPVLSTCWLIKAESVRQAGGFEAVERKVMPESYFAAQTAKHDDGYSFLRAEGSLNVTSSKSFAEQLATAVRTRYPQLHKRIEMVALVGLAEFMVLAWPFVALVIALLGGVWILAGVSAAGCLMATIIYSKIVNLTYREFVLGGLMMLPLAAIYDIALLNYSMWQYEFSEVTWKGRNVCLPVMRATRLPSPLPVPAPDSAQKP